MPNNSAKPSTAATVLGWAITVAIVLSFDPALAVVPFGMADPTFNSPQFTSRAYPGYCRSDGRGGLLWSFDSYVPSDFNGANGIRLGNVVRTTTDGLVDPNFTIGPALQNSAGTALLADGKILVGGSLVGDVTADGVPNYRVFRFLTNGVLDTSYHSPVFGGPPRFMSVQPDGKLLAAWTDLSGTMEANGGISGLARLNSDGSLDAGFQSPNLGGSFVGGSFGGVFGPPTLDTNGMIYIVGGFTQVNGQNRQGVARLNADGTLDSNFVPTGYRFSLFVRDVLPQSGGKVVIAGRLRLSTNTTPPFTYYPLMRLNSDGSFDNSFSLVTASSINFFRARRLKATADGKLLTVSTSIARFNSDGSLDSTFTRLPFGDAAGNPASYIECYWFEQLADGRIVIPGDPRFGNGPATINGQPFNGSVRLLADGTLDTNFSSPTFQGDIFPTTVARESDGRPLVGGYFDHVGPTAKMALARLNTNGLPDPSYALAISNITTVLSLAAVVQSNQAYALIQTFDVFVGTSNALVRLQADGAVDPGFNTDLGTIEPEQAQDLLLQGGQPIVGGPLSAQSLVDHMESGVPTGAPFVRFLDNGDPDTNFQSNLLLPGGGVFADGSPISMSNCCNAVTTANVGKLFVGDVQLLSTTPDQKLIVASGNRTSEGYYAYQISRLATNGASDASFSNVTVSPARPVVSQPVVQFPDGTIQVQASYPVRCLAAAIVESNGTIVIAGTFTNVNGAFRPGIARLRADSTLDATFPAGAGPATADGSTRVEISGLSVDSVGKVWATGNFTKWDGVTANGYVRLNADGTVDRTCLPQSNFYGIRTFGQALFSGALPGAGDEYFVFGSHRLATDLWPRGVTRLVSYTPPPLFPLGLSPGLGFGMTVDLLDGQYYKIQASSDLKTWQDWKVLQGNGGPEFIYDSEAGSVSLRFYRAGFKP